MKHLHQRWSMVEGEGSTIKYHNAEGKLTIHRHRKSCLISEWWLMIDGWWVEGLWLPWNFDGSCLGVGPKNDQYTACFPRPLGPEEPGRRWTGGPEVRVMEVLHLWSTSPSCMFHDFRIVSIMNNHQSTCLHHFRRRKSETGGAMGYGRSMRSENVGRRRGVAKVSVGLDLPRDPIRSINKQMN